MDDLYESTSDEGKWDLFSLKTSCINERNIKNGPIPIPNIPTIPSWDGKMSILVRSIGAFNTARSLPTFVVR